MSMEPVVLRSERLVLRAPDAGDIDTIAALCQDPDVQHWTTVPSPYTREDAAQFVQEVVSRGWAEDTGHQWGIRADDRLLGMIGLTRIGHGEAELGYWLAPEARGHGLMSEAVATVLDHGFRALPIQRVEWHAKVGNFASAAVARRAGFRFEGMSRLGGLQRGRRVDDWQAGLLVDDPRAEAGGWPAQTFGAQTFGAQEFGAQTFGVQES
jgi:Acetyltransferases, including N-acetylases of ribosomal proteins